MDFDQLMKRIDKNLIPTHNFYILEEWVPFAKKCIKKGYLPSDTNIIIIPKILVGKNVIGDKYEDSN